MKHVLVTGGAGYIGSHVCVELLQAGYKLVVVDNLSRSHAVALDRVSQITGMSVPFVKADVRDEAALRHVFAEYEIDAVMHFAGLKAVGESVEQPLVYYDNNVGGTLKILEAMVEHGVKSFVFSSSATVYGGNADSPIGEEAPCEPFNPYGRTKRMVEEVLEDMAASDPQWHVALLRYFNPVGAHESGLLGEDPNGIPNNLMPCIVEAAAGHRPELQVYGDDYPTPDGTGVRDYIHVVDLARGHVKALEKMEGFPGANVWNLGTGHGYSVLELVREFEKVTGLKLPYRIVPRRPGDIAVCYANPDKAGRDLEWKAARGLSEMCEDVWRWHSMNPNGYL